MANWGLRTVTRFAALYHRHRNTIKPSLKVLARIGGRTARVLVAFRGIAPLRTLKKNEARDIIPALATV